MRIITVRVMKQGGSMLRSAKRLYLVSNMFPLKPNTWYWVNLKKVGNLYQIIRVLGMPNI